MIELEERLRRDLQWVSQRADAGSIRPLRVPPVRRRSRAVRWLAPVAAVAAVIGVVTGVSLASRSQGHRSAGVLSPIQPEPAGPMPRYYVTAFQSFVGPAPSHIVTMAVVHDSATGAALATVPVPTVAAQGGVAGPSITAGDNLTYIISQGGRYYLMRVAADGRSASFGRLDIPISPHATDRIALSPNDSMVATAVQFCHPGGCQSTGIQVVTLATGASRTWTTQVRGAPFSVSWAGNGHVAFQWRGGYRLLDITQPGGNLLAAQPIAGPPPVAEDYGFVPPALVTSDGRAVITSTVQNIPESRGRDTVVAKIVELDASTGQLLKVLYTAIAHHVTTQQDVTQTNVSDLDQGCQVLSLGPAGVQPLVNCFTFGRVENGRLTPLPGFPSPSVSGIAGQQAAAW